MNERTKNLIGSPSRDEFKRRHKDLSPQFWAMDLDFCLIDKTPIPDIVAAIDYKQGGDSVTFSEVIAYNALLRRGIDVFIVTGDATNGIFLIEKWFGGHHSVPRIDKRHVETVQSWDEFAAWESQLRNEFKQRYSQYVAKETINTARA